MVSVLRPPTCLSETDNTEPSGEANSTAEQEQVRMQRRHDVGSGARSALTKNTSRHGQQHWEEAAQEVAIPRSSILRCLDVLHGQLLVGRQRGDAFNKAVGHCDARAEALHR